MSNVVHGTFKDFERMPDVQCVRCGERGKVECREWESYDEAFEDYQYRCAACGFTWWVEGIDS